MDPSTVYSTLVTQSPNDGAIGGKTTAAAADDDDDEDVGIGSVQQNIPPIGNDVDLMPSKFPAMGGGPETDDNELHDDDVAARSNPKHKPLKGKNGSEPSASPMSRIYASLVVLVTLAFMF